MLGCCLPKDLSKQTNKIIDERLERDRKEMDAESKLLLLGELRVFSLIQLNISYFFENRQIL